MSTLISSCCRTRLVTCPNGNPVSLAKTLRCQLKQTDPVVRQFQANVKGAVDALNKVSLELTDVNIRSEAIVLKDKLTNDGQTRETTIRAAVAAMQINPCEMGQALMELLAQMNKDITEVQKLTLTIESSNKSALAVQNAINDFEVAYSLGSINGTLIVRITRALDDYFLTNNKYPSSLQELDVAYFVSQLRAERLSYKLIASNRYELKYAGLDGVIDTIDDKIHIGKDGTTSLRK